MTVEVRKSIFEGNPTLTVLSRGLNLVTVEVLKKILMRDCLLGSSVVLARALAPIYLT